MLRDLLRNSWIFFLLHVPWVFYLAFLHKAKWQNSAGAKKLFRTCGIFLLNNQKFHFVFKKNQKIVKKRQCLCNSNIQNPWKEYKQLLYYPWLLIFLGWLKLDCFQLIYIKLNHCAVHEGCALGLTFITKGTMRIINVRIYTYT